MGWETLTLFLRKLGADPRKQTPGNPTPMSMQSGLLSTQLRAEYCTHCGKAGSVQKSAGARYLSKCAGCSRTRYCNKACQAAHWKAGHSVMCKRAAQNRGPAAPTPVPAVPEPIKAVR